MRVQSGKYTTVGYAKREQHGQWRGDAAAYSSIHCWLVRNYGKATHCEAVDCPGVPEGYKWFEWALKKGHHHSHNITHYQQMCRSCHRKYDQINRKVKSSA